MTKFNLKYFLFLPVLLLAFGGRADLTDAMKGVDRDLIGAAVPRQAKSVVTAVQNTHAEDSEAQVPALALLNTEEPTASAKKVKRDCCGQCWFDFKRFFKKGVSATEYFLDRLEELYPTMRGHAENAMMWSQDIAAMFGNEKLAKQLEKISKAGGEYADKARKWLQVAENSTVLLKQMSTVMNGFDFVDGKAFYADLRGLLPTVIAYASDARNGSFVFGDEANHFAFYAKRELTDPTLQLTFDMQILNLLKTDYENKTEHDWIGFQGDDLDVYRGWVAEMNKAQVGVGAKLKHTLTSLVDVFAKVARVTLDPETGAISFGSASVDAKGESILTIRFPGFDKNWTPGNAPEVVADAEEEAVEPVVVEPVVSEPAEGDQQHDQATEPTEDEVAV